MKTAAKCIALAPFIAGDPHSDITLGDNIAHMQNTGTTWVRLWADWPTCWPTAEGPDESYMAALGGQIAAARAGGLKVCLTAYRYPRWANHVTPEAVPDDWRASLRVPDALGPNSQWGRWIKLLVERFGPSLARLEVCNEPNAMNWPQLGMPARVAVMFATAQKITAVHDHRPRLGGPALADYHSRPERTVDFAVKLLVELERVGFVAGEWWTWTHHNYMDMTFARWSGTDTTSVLRRLLTGGWRGATGPLGPYIALTEGGVKRDVLAKFWPGVELDGLQRDRLGLAMQQLRRDNGPGQSVAMLTQYLLRTDPGFDTGLLETDGRPRPALDRWRS